MKTTALRFLDNFLCLFTIQFVGCQILLGLILCHWIKSTQRGCHNYPKRNLISNWEIFVWSNLARVAFVARWTTTINIVIVRLIESNGQYSGNIIVIVTLIESNGQYSGSQLRNWSNIEAHLLYVDQWCHCLQHAIHLQIKKTISDLGVSNKHPLYVWASDTWHSRTCKANIMRVYIEKWDQSYE